MSDSAIDAYGLAPESLREASRGGFLTQRLQASAHVPDYLRRHYWWAYVHPRAVAFFDRQWLVNAILWGHMVACATQPWRN